MRTTVCLTTVSTLAPFALCRYPALGEARGSGERSAAAAAALQEVLAASLEALATLLPAGSFRVAPPVCQVCAPLRTRIAGVWSKIRFSLA